MRLTFISLAQQCPGELKLVVSRRVTFHLFMKSNFIAAKAHLKMEWIAFGICVFSF